MKKLFYLLIFGVFLTSCSTKMVLFDKNTKNYKIIKINKHEGVFVDNIL